MVRSVLIVVAMEEEALPLVEALGLRPNNALTKSFLPGLPAVAWSGPIAGTSLGGTRWVGGTTLTATLVWVGRDRRSKANSVATAPAVVSTYAALVGLGEAGRPDLIISAGTAGGLQQRGAAIGDVFLSTKTVFHDRRIPEGDGSFEEYGFGHFRSPPLAGLAEAAGLKQGVVSTADSLDHTAQDMQLMLSEGAVVKEMEAAAVAWLADTLRIPFIALKSVTDVVDGAEPTREEFESNLKMAAAALKEKMASVLRLLGQRPALRAWALSSPAPPPPPPPPPSVSKL